jgi:arylsulfatase A-like enzyme
MSHKTTSPRKAAWNSVAILILVSSLFTSAQAADRPNILLILTDDVGYGDLSSYNPESEIPTPHLDKLALQGMRFTDAHSPATVCTPTRYSLMTGGLCFRTGSSPVFTGVGGPCLIKDAQLTLPEMLKEAGYATAMTGKWHIGLTFFDKQGQPIHNGGLEGVRRIDYSKPMKGGPLDHGFGKFFGTACCPTTDFLYAYIENDRVPHPPSGMIDKSRYPQNAYTRDFREGLASEEFDASEVDMVFLEKSRAFLREHVQSKPGQPFFLFHSMQAVHLPSIPAASFRGKTQSGPHGDFIHQMDWTVGELTRELEALGVTDNTLVIFCSDNGPEVPTVLDMRKTYQHDGARPWRGVKRDSWEGGHRTPFIVKWPGRVAAGIVSDQLLSLTDIFATTAAIIKRDLPTDAAVDSYNMLPVLEGKEIDGMLRPYLLQQTHWEQAMSIRVGRWKYLDHKGSGGNDYDRDNPEWSLKPYQLPDTAPEAPGQLYHLASDPGETTNLYFQHPGTTRQLKALLDKAVASQRREWIQVPQPFPAEDPSE